jgi:hypothetical protein
MAYLAFTMFKPGTTLDTCLHAPLNYLMSEEYVFVSEAINHFLPCLTAESFTIGKTYKVFEAVDPTKTWGKFPGALNNFVLIDKNYLLSDLVDMVYKKLEATLLREANLDNEYMSTFIKLLDHVRKISEHSKIDEYAFQVCGKMRDRNDKFINGWEHGKERYAH